MHGIGHIHGYLCHKAHAEFTYGIKDDEDIRKTLQITEDQAHTIEHCRCMCGKQKKHPSLDAFDSRAH